MPAFGISNTFLLFVYTFLKRYTKEHLPLSKPARHNLILPGDFHNPYSGNLIQING